MRELLETNGKRVANTSQSILSCNIGCAKDICLDTFKKKVPFPVSMGCIRAACSCQALDLNANAYQQFMSEVARRAASGASTDLPEAENDSGLDIESITGGLPSQQ